MILDATERLLLEAFLVQHDNDLHIPNELQTLAESPNSSKLQVFLDSLDFKSFVTDYNFVRQQVRLGKFGNTAKFWVICMDSVWHLLHFQQAIKENNFNLYLSSMYCLCSLLFAADHENYARYLPYEIMKLKNLSLTQPEAEELFRDNDSAYAGHP